MSTYLDATPLDPPGHNAPQQIAGHRWLELSPRVGAIVIVVAICSLCLGYTLFTDQTWEDSLITLRHSENLLNGNGLTYNLGQRVHGFTSPINVLLLVVCHFLTSQSSYAATFWLYRIFSVAAFAWSGVLLLRALHDTSPRWFAATWFLGIVYLFDVKTVAFSTNGMETAFMLLFAAWAVYLISRATPDQWLLRGLCWGGMMWARPDGCVYIAALSLAELIFLSTSRRATFVSLVKSAAICFAIYVPWLLWAGWYYGSPVPHTIIAKANVEQGTYAQLLNVMDNYLVTIVSVSAQAFRPIYCGEQTLWLGVETLGRVMSGLTKIVGLVALLYFVYPTEDRFGRAMSFCFAVVCSYFTYMPAVYPWYFPPATLFGITAFTRAAITFAKTPEGSSLLNRGLQLRKVVALMVLVILACGAILLFWPASLEERIQQAEIEMGNRAEIGKWLKANGKPTENIYLEPLGYIGYFSGMRMDDFPGLVSPDVVKLRRKLPKDPSSAQISRLLVIPMLKPDWVVLRFGEYNRLTTLPIFKAFKQDYSPAREFNVNDKLSQHRYLPGEPSLRFDAGFVVFRRKPPPQF